MSEPKTPGWARAAQIGLGAIAIILSILMLVYPVVVGGLTIATFVIIGGIILLVVGIERVIVGIFVKSKARWSSIGLGILVIILSLILIAFPIGTTIFLIILIGVALFIDGVARLVHGFGNKEEKGWSRYFAIGVGALEIILGIMIFISPTFGVAFVAILIGVGLLIAGIQMIVTGISGRRMTMLRR
jgi:uncharacterized membrane protein HdeD (DUF308 family)